MRETLRKVFGFHEFRPNQEPIVEAIMAGRDVFAVMPTGGGKSLCYQLPARMTGRTAVVISPLISLMKDQVDAARANGLRAAFLNSSLSAAEKGRVYGQLRSGRLELLYLAPERLNLGGFLESLAGMPISLFAVDEAHCVSEWGHDFRPDYLSLSAIKKAFPQVPLAAFTATATLQVQADVLGRLGLADPLVVRASFDRPNFFIEVRPKDSAEDQALDFIRERPGQAGIVYRTSRKSVEHTAFFLERHGVAVRPYHAGLPDDERKANQEAFRKDQVDVVVATIAFGMGIDKPNVRFVVHADLPRSIEGYYQEIGRAGRDGEPAHCLLFFGGGDVPKLRHFIDEIEDEKVRRAAARRLARMVEYAESRVCRRKSLLDYFGEKYWEPNCHAAADPQAGGGCDVCRAEASGVAVPQVDATVDAQKLLSAMARTDQRFGAKHVIDIVVGAKTERILELGHGQLKTYGVGREHSREHWRRVLDEMLARRVVVREGDEYPVLKMTALGAEVLRGKCPFTMDALPEPAEPAAARESARGKGRKKAAKKPAVSPPGPMRAENGPLFERLRALRLKLAEEQGVPPYVIFHNRALQEMAERRPTTLAEMAEINGVGEAKLDAYGKLFADEIEAFLGER
ncbi:MAG TPA: DNA helicase RecQ [Planctomycetota bacterium]|nr:DNA helicase RecQ [Planctomycetota bacterium]